jgi:hypothetical protein
MGMPKKSIDYVDTNKKSIGKERVDDIIKSINMNSLNFPKQILLKDIDEKFLDYFENDKPIVIYNKKLKPVYLESELQGEFEKTWTMMNADKNVMLPLLTIQRTDVFQGTLPLIKWRIPNGKKFVYDYIPEIRDGYLYLNLYKMKQPTLVDLRYEVTLFTKYRDDLNQFDEMLLSEFSDRQEYVMVNGRYMPIHIESDPNEDVIDDVEAKKIYTKTYTFYLGGYLIRENDYEIVSEKRLKKFDINAII